MARRPLSELTPEEAEATRAYMRVKKAESRHRLKEEGECIVRTAECTGKAKPGGSTCYACDAVRQEQARKAAKEQGWKTAPSKKIPRTIRKLFRQGIDVKDIVKDSYLMDYEVSQKEVREVLKAAELL
jgi:hypothetical protein